MAEDIKGDPSQVQMIKDRNEVMDPKFTYILTPLIIIYYSQTKIY